MTSCDRSEAYGINDYPICSNHGTCVDHYCICDEHWTGYTDLQLTSPGYDCDINLNAIQIWCIVNMILSCTGIIIIFYCIIREKIHLPDRRYKPKFFCLLMFFGITICSLLFSIEKYHDPLHHIIGRSYRLELWGLGITSLTCYGVSTYFIIMVKFLKTYARLIDPIVRERISSSADHLVAIAPIFATFFFLSYGILLLSLHFISKEHSDKFCVAECVLYVMAYVYYGFTVLYILHVFLREMSKIVAPNNTIATPVIQTTTLQVSSTSTLEDTRKVYRKIKLANRFILPFYINGIPLNFFFASWYFIRRKIVFFYLFQITLVILMSMFLVMSLTSVKKTSYETKFSEISSKVKSSLSMAAYSSPGARSSISFSVRSSASIHPAHSTVKHSVNPTTVKAATVKAVKVMTMKPVIVKISPSIIECTNSPTADPFSP